MPDSQKCLMKQCKLCRNKRELKYSHIIPEFFYKWLYDGKHRYRTFSTYENRPRPMEQKGVREHLLCSECESKLSEWETYACNILTDDAVQFGDRDHCIVMDVDYEKFKLFELSILWRVSVANHQLCEESSFVGSHEEEDLRSFISEGRAPKANEYGSIKFALLGDDGRRQMDYIPQPEPICDENRVIQHGFWRHYVVIHYGQSPGTEKICGMFSARQWKASYSEKEIF